MLSLAIVNKRVGVISYLKLANVLLLIFLGVSTCYKVWEPVSDWQSISLLFIGTMIAFIGLHLMLYKGYGGVHEVRPMLIVSAAGLIAMNLILWPSKQYLPEQLIEHSMQMTLPFILWYWMGSSSFSKRLAFGLKVVVALTFVGHGLFAIGWHGVPDHFVGMTQRILFLSESQTSMFLTSAGVLDFAVAIMIFFKPTVRFGLIYMIVWGTLTALARPISNLHLVDTADFWFVHFPGMVYRLPHAIIPLLLLRKV